MRRVYGAQLANATYSTVYMNTNGIPHKVAYGRCQDGTCGGDECHDDDNDEGCGDYGRWRGKGKRARDLHRLRGGDDYGNGGGGGGGSGQDKCRHNKATCTPVNYLMDEQGDVVTLNQVDKFVYGGGVLHTVNSVLQANDIFPSLSAALSSSDNFSVLLQVLGIIDTAFNITLLQRLEAAPGTMAVPSNQARTLLHQQPLLVRRLQHTHARTPTPPASACTSSPTHTHTNARAHTSTHAP
jgi:hypothetical protein